MGVGCTLRTSTVDNRVLCRAIPRHLLIFTCYLGICARLKSESLVVIYVSCSATAG
ncbi:hypothetical protein GGI43DRAFT_412215 [Trichoderma evansii]